MAGVVQPAATVCVTAGVPGTVLKLRADVGDVVQAGDVLAELDAVRYKLELGRAQAKVFLAQAQMNEVKAGFREVDLGKSPAKERIATAEAEVRLAMAELHLANHNVEATQLHAPIAGTVLTRHADVGEFVAPQCGEGSSGRLFEIADLSALEVTANVPESLAGNVLPGRRCRVQTAVPNAVYQGEVAWVGPVVDSRTGVFPIRGQFTPSENNTRLLPGTSVRMVFGDEE